MPTLADWVPDLDEILSAIYRRVNPDATMTALLGGSNRVIASPSAPPRSPLPRLNIWIINVAVDPENMTARVLCAGRARAKNPNLGTVEDRETLGNICQRLGQLVVGVHDAQPFSDANYRFMDSWLEAGFGPMTDEEAPEEGWQEQRFVLRCHRL